MKDSNGTETKKGERSRIATPSLTAEQKSLIDRYCVRYHHKPGPAVLFAALREICREFDLPIEELGRPLNQKVDEPDNLEEEP
jgi:hypothetical protein